tara:strand:+ start:90 stop:452 length:363 start_codon:yes stop_codon:yes gene_type:complete
MKYSCKNCGKDFTSNINQVMINDIILSGRKYINSDGVEEKYKEVKTSCDEFSEFCDYSKKEIKTIVIDTKAGFYKITTDVVGYYSTSSHQIGEDVLSVALARIKLNDGINDLSEYQITIK